MNVLKIMIQTRCLWFSTHLFVVDLLLACNELRAFLFLGQKFFCGGRLIFGPDAASLFLSTLLISGPAIAFSIKAYLKIDSHPCFLPVLIVSSILTLLVSASTLH